MCLKILFYYEVMLVNEELPLTNTGEKLRAKVKDFNKVTRLVVSRELPKKSKDFVWASNKSRQQILVLSLLENGLYLLDKLWTMFMSQVQRSVLHQFSAEGSFYSRS